MSSVPEKADKLNLSLPKYCITYLVHIPILQIVEYESMQ